MYVNDIEIIFIKETLKFKPFSYTFIKESSVFKIPKNTFIFNF